jgi:hypothetical protein
MAANNSRLTHILEAIDGAARIAVCVVFRLALRPWYSRWGATGDEARRRLPGDERVPHSKLTNTLAVSVRAPAARVWPWLAQIGQERGGLYSYELLENIARCNMHNADRIVPEWQLKAGDAVRLGPKGYPLYRVIEAQPNRALVMAAADLKTEQVVELSDPPPATYANSAWTLVVDERADGTTRLISRNLLDYAPENFLNRLMWRWLTDPIGFVMTRKMLLGIKRRAEAVRP